MTSCHNPVSFHEFEAEEIREAVANGRLLSAEIEFSRRCNFRCPYCYVEDGSASANEMTPDEICDVIAQARDLGAKKIIILGGEPMIYPRIRDMIRFIRGHGLAIEMFTNGTNVTHEAARFLFEQSVNVVLKMNTRDERLQDKLSGVPAASRIIRAAFDNLRQAGYPAPGRIFGVSTVICGDNADELPGMWQWLRDQSIAPYFEMITPHGNALHNQWLGVDEEKAAGIFRTIAEMDRARYGFHWEPQPPLVGGRCLRHQFSCLVTAVGDVLPCVGVTLPVGNIRERKLADIVRDSEVMQDLRQYRKTLRGPCAECEKAAECYGCRGTAYQLTGDYLASDPSCWCNRERKDEILRFPIPIDGMIPQKHPMRVVDRLMKVAERTAEVEYVVDAASPFVGVDGLIDPSAYLEIMAQAMAALNGFRENRGNGVEPRGFLLGARSVRVLGAARAGDRLKVGVRKLAKLGGFGVMEGRVARDGALLAVGEIKVWHKQDEAGEAAEAGAGERSGG